MDRRNADGEENVQALDDISMMGDAMDELSALEKEYVFLQVQVEELLDMLHFSDEELDPAIENQIDILADMIDWEEPLE
jgi:hypothetical protein